jgi:glycosyltransferase involved in cell wall biosynthesis
MPTISYAITACNEHTELDRLLDQLSKKIPSTDEIIVQLDSENFTQEVEKVVEKYHNITRIYYSLNSDFAAFKNNLKKHCIKDYIFFIDADEYLSDTLLLNISQILEINDTVDIFAIPRINTVEGLTQEHIQKWGWNINKEGWVNYPDYQTRLCKNTNDTIWEGKVHERLVKSDACNFGAFPSGFELVHPKDIERQERQNDFYSKL